MWILFYGEGRLGNQVFQYQALTRVAASTDRIIAVGLEDLGSTFDLQGPSVRVLTRSRWVKRFFKYLLIPYLIRPLARTLRVIGYAHEPRQAAGAQSGASGELNFRDGMLSSIVFVDGGYYQNASLWPQIFPAPSSRLKPALRERARDFLASLGLPPDTVFAFVHVRRGDYLTHVSHGLGDLALPETFYRRSIHALQDRVGATHLLFVTDDPEWVRKRYGDLNMSVTSLSAELDFAVMTQCAAGIVSNSTYALAAALHMDRPQLVIAPRFWLGFHSGEWVPPRIRFEHARIVYVSVDPGPQRHEPHGLDEHCGAASI